MKYKIADLIINIKGDYPFTERVFREYLTEENAKENIVVSLKESDIKKESQALTGCSLDYLTNLCVYRKICEELPKYSRFLLHATIVEKGGFAYAFLGKSGAGKTTHAGLWEKYFGAKILSGDKPIISQDNGEFTAFGTPFNGKEGFGYNGAAKLKALCFIRQAKDIDITRLSEKEITGKIFSQVFMPKEERCVKNTLRMINGLVKLPCYEIKCDISKESAGLSYCALTGENYEN